MPVKSDKMIVDYHICDWKLVNLLCQCRNWEAIDKSKWKRGNSLMNTPIVCKVVHENNDENNNTVV